MPYIFAAILELITVVVSKIFNFVARRLPVILATVALIVSIAVTYLTAMHAVIDSIGQTIPAVVADVWGWVMPGNAIQCLAAVVSARIIRWSYSKYEKIVIFKAKALTQ